MTHRKGNEINFSRDMHKTAFYSHQSVFQNYFPGDTNYSYDVPYGQPNMSPSNGDFFSHPSCAVQNSSIPSPTGNFSTQYTGSDGYSNHLTGVGSPNSTSYSNKGEIYPWMKESRQNSKQRQAATTQPQTQQQQQQTQPNQQQPGQTGQATTPQPQPGKSLLMHVTVMRWGIYCRHLYSPPMTAAPLKPNFPMMNSPVS